MSLQYIIDGYNVIKHPFFARTARAHKYSGGTGGDSRESFLRFLRLQQLTGSSKNKVSVVFDGYSGNLSSGDYAGFEVIFSCSESADERIKHMVESSPRVKEIVVVSDDRAVQFFARSSGAAIMGIEEFIGGREEKARTRRQGEETPDPKITYTQMERINKELREKWLK